MAQPSPYNGILIFNKPQGFTSHDVVAKLRGILHTKKIGHGGTLDPMATGVLPIFVGSATKAAEYAAVQEKEYQAGFTLGMATDTQDSTGKIIAQSDLKVTEEQVRTALQTFLGHQKQIPPMYSAIKIDGQKLYDLARKGREVQRPPRDIHISEIELCTFDAQKQQGQFRVVCSKGTYVRTIVHDLGQKLGTYATMHTLIRTRAGNYTLENALSFEQLEQQNVSQLFQPTDGLFMQYPALSLDEEGQARALRGAVVFDRQTTGFEHLPPKTLCRVYYQGTFCMLGRVDTLEKGGLGLFVHKNFR